QSSSYLLFDDPATTKIYSLSLHDALPIFLERGGGTQRLHFGRRARIDAPPGPVPLRLERLEPPNRGVLLRPGGEDRQVGFRGSRSEEHTSELQSRENLVCRLLLEKKNGKT